MGAYFLVVNPARMQYLDPSRFGEGIKASSVLRGDFCIRALKLLVMDCYPRDAASFPGAWLGDPVILAGDDNGLPDPGGIVATSPHPNLNALAQAEYADISYRALAELASRASEAAELAEAARENDSLLLELGGVLDQYRVPNLEIALNEAVGRPWRQAWKKALAGHPSWYPPPPIDWPF
ncbi:MAG: hypothetical protein U0800_13125 [Isosphaeraceae bacterium]